MAPSAEIISFGYVHGPAPEADLTLDVRVFLRDPHVACALRQLTGRDEPVRQHVLATLGAGGLIDAVANAVDALLWAARYRRESGPVRVAIGCAGGRHRSVVLADAVAEMLGANRWVVDVCHRDLDRPVVQRATAGGSR